MNIKLNLTFPCDVDQFKPMQELINYLQKSLNDSIEFDKKKTEEFQNARKLQKVNKIKSKRKVNNKVDLPEEEKKDESN